MSDLIFCDIPAIVFELVARKLRFETEGGLYPLIARGNDRQNIFHSLEGHTKFLALLIKEKLGRHFYYTRTV